MFERYRTPSARLAGIGSAVLLAPVLLAAGAPKSSVMANPPADGAVSPAAHALHVLSPDWRDQIVYLAMIDRFDDGDPRNNDQYENEFNPRDNAKYSGGDLRGLLRRVDYIRGLGATSIWITPPVANQWWNPATHYGGYHGYWAEDFKRVDAHFGNLRDYKALSRAIHAAGMYLIQDVVVNHTANYSGYVGGWDPNDPAAHFTLHASSYGKTAPTRAPFSLNDARNPRHRAAGIYHWTPDIDDFTDRQQELNHQLSGVDDLNTENPVVRAALRDAHGYWIREVGVDAFRVDTAFYVPAAFFTDFLDAGDIRNPGVRRVAQSTGRDDFHVFGEGFGIDRAFEETQARKIDSYMRGSDGQKLLPGMINFPLYGTLTDVFARGRPTAELGHRIGSMMRVHADPHRMPTFVDNHDVDRYLAGGDEAGLKQALLAILTLPGIPTIYYGTEQGLREQRAALFAGGYGSGGRDRFDTQSPMYRYLQRAIALRRGHRVFSRGVPAVIAHNAAAPGVFAYRMTHEGRHAVVAFNSAVHDALLENVDTGLAPGTVLRGAFAIEGEAPEIVVDAQGRIALPLAARAGLVWLAEAPTRAVTAPKVSIHFDADAPAQVSGDFVLRGHARGVDAFRLVVDGNLRDAVLVHPDANGRWKANVGTSSTGDDDAPHRVVAWDPTTGALSGGHEFRVARAWTLLADIDDPAGDDAGPAGRYLYPTSPEWRQQRPLDLRRIRVFGAGGALKIEITTHRRLSMWNSPKGFDHIAYTIFVAVPGRGDGAQVMPQQNAQLPGNMRWHVRARAHGWTNALFDARGASATSEGTAITPASAIELGPDENTVTFTLPASALGHPRTFSGAQLFVNTWDYDGGYRHLGVVPTGYTMGGGDGATDPLWMDDSGVITLR